MSVRATMFLAVMILIALIGYDTLVRDQSNRAASPSSGLPVQTPATSSEEFATISAVGDAPTDAWQESVNQNGLHQRLLSMDETDRNQIFNMILRDTDFKCAEVLRSELIISDSGAWRADCGKAWAYSILLDDNGSTIVHPIQYGDFEDPIRIQIAPQ